MMRVPGSPERGPLRRGAPSVEPALTSRYAGSPRLCWTPPAPPFAVMPFRRARPGLTPQTCRSWTRAGQDGQVRPFPARRLLVVSGGLLAIGGLALLVLFLA